MPTKCPVPIRQAALLLCLGGIPFASPAYAEGTAEEETFWTQETMTGDWAGLRSALEDRGISLEISEIFDFQGNTAGGLRRGATGVGRGLAELTVDLEKVISWPGAKFVVSGLQIHGRGLSANYVGNLLTVSGVEAPTTTRLNDLYLEQSLFDDALNIRIGQFAADEEFMVSEVAATFVNTTVGWPSIFGLDLPGGGPAYPLATPGVRARYDMKNGFSIQAAVFNGNPLGARGDFGGTEFPINGAFVIAEATFSTMPEKNELGYGGNFKLGFWYNSLHFSDQRYDNTGLSLADPASTGIPRSHRGNVGLYAMVDHTIWRPWYANGEQGLAGFVRFEAVPQQDRNPTFVSLDAGLTWKGTFPDRDDDVVGFAFAWLNQSNSLAGFDRDTIFFTGVQQPIHSSEMMLELTYQAAITPWLSLQPDFQYIIRPGANAPNPNNPAVALKNAVVLGLRTAIKF